MGQQNLSCTYLGDELANYGFSDAYLFDPLYHHILAQVFYQQSMQEKQAFTKIVAHLPQMIIFTHL
jgi:hypothetical protein